MTEIVVLIEVDLFSDLFLSKTAIDLGQLFLDFVGLLLELLEQQFSLLSLHEANDLL